MDIKRVLIISSLLTTAVILGNYLGSSFSGNPRIESLYEVAIIFASGFIALIISSYIKEKLVD